MSEPEPRQARYKRERAKNRRHAWLAVNGPCVDCGSWDNLEIDHVDPTTKNHAIFWLLSEKRLAEELAKCAPRCRSCHEAKTRRENSGENHPFARLSQSDVDAIRSSSERAIVLAERYGVHKRTIYKIRSFSRWNPLGPTRGRGGAQ